MKRPGGWIALAVLTLAVGGGLGWQRWQAMLLRIGREPLREQARDLERLRTENTRLKKARTSDADIARWKAEREEWQRLHAQREALQAKAGMPVK
jgi:hypothetical protein